jgi:hypothetical protein
MRARTVPYVIALATFAVFAIPASAALAQQDQLNLQQTGCNAAADGRGLSGATRTMFMSNCLKHRCNAAASAQKLSGPPRREFMTRCQKGLQ